MAKRARYRGFGVNYFSLTIDLSDNKAKEEEV